MSQERIEELRNELKVVENTISQWCMRMAWPGGTPTPPFAAWEKRAAIWGELKSLGIANPKYFHMEKPLL